MKKTSKYPYIKKIWDFLWHEDSILSWLVNILIAILLVKFVIYPLLGLAFGTSLPVVAVVSGSMDHQGSFDDWWTSKISYNETQAHFYLSKFITKQQFQMYPLSNGFSKGDVIILTGADAENLKKGEVIVFQSGKQYPIIHRIVDVHDNYYETKGDHNPGQANDLELNEFEVRPEQIIGKANFKIPWLGWIKIAFSCGINSIFGNSFTECMS